MRTELTTNDYAFVLNERMVSARSQIWFCNPNDEYKQMNILEMIKRANTHIYIVAKSDSNTFDATVIEALKNKPKWVQIHVALEEIVDAVPPIWKDIKSRATTFRLDVPSTELGKMREAFICDDTIHCEVFTSMAANTEPRWYGFTETHSDLIDTVGSRYFHTGPKALTRAVRPQSNALKYVGLPIVGALALGTVLLGLKGCEAVPVCKKAVPILNDVGHVKGE